MKLFNKITPPASQIKALSLREKREKPKKTLVFVMTRKAGVMTIATILPKVL